LIDLEILAACHTSYLCSNLTVLTRPRQFPGYSNVSKNTLYYNLKWVKDIIEIGQQDRPDIFDLKAARPPPLYAEVLEIDERVITSREDCQLSSSDCNIEKGSTGEDFIIKTVPDKKKIFQDLKNLKENGIESIAIVLLHAYAYHKHESLIEQIAKARSQTKLAF